MRRGAALVDWRSGLLAYVEADEETLKKFREIMALCGGNVEPRTLPCLSSLASRLSARSVLYITDLYGIANSLAFERKTPRGPLLEKAWAYLSELICRDGEVECGEEVALACCRPCGDACRLAEILGAAKVGVEVDLREELRRRL